MTSQRSPLKLSLLVVGIASACSLTVPSEDEVFGDAPGGSSGSSASGSSGNAAPIGGESAGGTGSGGNGGMAEAEGGQSPLSGAGSGAGGDAGAPPLGDGGAGGEPSEPKPMGEVVNPSFEGSLNGWTISPKTTAIFIQYTGANVTAVQGNSVLSGWHATETYKTQVYQIVRGLEDGTYRLSAQMAAKFGMPSAKLYAQDCGGADPEPAESSAEAWHEVAIEAVEVVGGQCKIGFDIDARAADWINIDVVGFTKVEPG